MDSEIVEQIWKIIFNGEALAVFTFDGGRDA